MISFQLQGEPLGKARPRFSRKTGRAYTPQKTVNYEARVAEAAARAMDGQEPFEGPLRLTIRADFLVPQSWSAKKKAAAVWKASAPDADNIAKCCKDGMNRIVYRDDAQIAELTVQKRYAHIACVTVTVEMVK